MTIRRSLLAMACALALGSAAPAAAQVPSVPLPGPLGGNQQLPQPYGQNDAGGFRNVLPPGENGLDNIVQFGQFEASGKRPPHFDDQLSLYTDLLYASPTLRHDQIANYYKDATFGVRSDDVESIIHPRQGVTIMRDKGYGVPHIYGDTRGDVMFDTGYAA